MATQGYIISYKLSYYGDSPYGFQYYSIGDIAQFQPDIRFTLKAALGPENLYLYFSVVHMISDCFFAHSLNSF